MLDHFALLDEPRRPWLDADSLKKKFLALSTKLHPDRTHTADDPVRQAAGKRFAELNAAHNCLRDPKERLRHLLELELGRKPEDLQQIPPDLADLFMEIAALCRQVDGFLAERARVSSPLLRAQLFERGLAWTDRLTALQRQINQHHDAVLAQLQRLDAQWEADGAVRQALLPGLEEVWRLLGFFTRWNGQIQERLARITF